MNLPTRPIVGPRMAGFVPVFVHGGDVAGAKPAILGPTMGLVGRFIVTGGNPRAADFDFTGGHAVPRSFAFRPHQANLYERSRPSLLGAHVIFFVLRPVTHVGAQTAGSADGRGFRHAPKMLDLQAETVEPPN